LERQERSSGASSPWTSPVVQVRNLSKDFGERRAVRGIDMTIHPAECLGLLGPNGAGKTTTISMLLGLVRPTSGDILILGEPSPERLRQIKRRTGVSSQTDNLDPDLTVLENLMTYASYFRLKRIEARERAEELLEFFALKNRRHDPVPELSGGQRRRLLIARALINTPDLLILDEPTVGLDPQARHLIWERLDALRVQGTTMLLTSHYMEEVSRLASRVMIMDEGKIVAQGEPGTMVADLIGTDVFEVVDTTEALDSLQKTLRSCPVTMERKGERIFVYTKGSCPEIEALAMGHRQVTRHPANLEDLFLKLTGRALREN